MAQFFLLNIERSAIAAREGLRLGHNARLSAIIFLVLAIALTVAKFVRVDSTQALGWDSAGFLSNGAVYAGFTQYQQGYDSTRPPLLPIILALFFKVTGPSVIDGYVLSAVLYFLAVIGAYLIAREIMNPWIAVLPAVSYGLAPMVVYWSGIVYSDVEGVALASLGLATFIIATNSQRGRLFALSIPLLFLAPLTRYALGIIFVPVLIYAFTTGNTRRILTNSWFRAGLVIAFVIVLMIGAVWVGYPLTHDVPLIHLFPVPQALNAYTNPQGHLFFLYNFAASLGYDGYGYILALAFTASIAFALITFPSARKQQSSNNRVRTTHAAVFALFAWFIILFLYYSWYWPYFDLRYSIEYILPVIVLAYWGLNLLIHSLNQSKRSLRILGTLILIVMIGLTVQSAVVAQTTPTVDPGLNAGFKQAATWIVSNVPASDHIQADWYTYLRWYLPQYNVSIAPAAYQLQTGGDYQNWLVTIGQENVQYVVYSDPAQISVPSSFQPVYYASDGVVVFKVS